MAERLTDKNGVEFTPECSKVNPLLTQGRCPFYDKLGNLEDILEKYGIESVEELEKKIGYYIDKIDLEAENGYLKVIIEKQNIVNQIISKERDTWQKACELACEREDDCYVYDNIHRAYEFYQQAKKEGNDE